MKFIVNKSKINGTIDIPGSKSHTIRALFFASLADGESKVLKPLISEDATSAVKSCEAFGLKIKKINDGFALDGLANKPQLPENIIDVGNSGTTLRIALGTAALIDGYTVFTGDEQIRNRLVEPVISAINNLGGFAATTKNNGKAPAIVKGVAKGGFTKLDGVSSQFLTSLLINCPLMEHDTTIKMIRLNEIPYVDITLWWLSKLGIKYENQDYKTFYIKGGQKYKSFSQVIPADFSSATFFIVLAAISGGKITITNLDMTDPQGDKLVLKIIEDMGAKVTYSKEGITIEGGNLKGIEVDANSIPDAIPALAVAGCFAEGETKLLNVPQARLKETDRIKVMFEELTKMGANIEELPDGLIIRKSNLKPASVNGRKDHRVVMALSLAGLCLNGETIIDTADAASVTFPNFSELIKICGGNIRSVE
ncbi:MAG: 3-phosphoshikimate 1-carboxyvinyltransferase [Spirochaetes bacterium GWD1_27_9]|nr:MAG: 3-phosphoshikimate 1-carboxyvinyltransferase [Spirochaetes bacterium GWB1_27_13]OHD22101.1 MAG: 3-phosphoshikimate 1-carboxyvinyltransferase [Spirochaetes bacterium GWC1_27_15]OHD28946.1 MAG: 3-phosphoshikimate 1-carboxyvinyltransferase [Spirochaetes bacterium GWD1_27_9]